jgi:pre-mRNA-splicing factor ATP-dependent RNA helicase DHX15/PRP43
MSDSSYSKGEKRASADSEDASRKKVRKDGEKYNPYLAHMYETDGAGRNGHQSEEPGPNSPFAGMKRRQTTAKQASAVEDLEENPFTGEPHSQKYFQILETRRNLPVHKQR